MSIWTKIKKIYKIIEEFFSRLESDHIYIISAGLAFNILLYQIPLFLLLTYVVELTIGFDKIAVELTDIVKEFLPPTSTSDNYITNILSEITNIVSHSSLFGLIGFIILIWISSTLISSLRFSINTVFKIPPKKYFFLDILKDMFLVILIPILFMLYTFLLPIVDLIQQILIFISPDYVNNLISNTTIVFTSLGTGFLIYYFIYSYIPSAKVERKKRIFASTLNTILIEISRNIFAWYLVSISNYGKYYGTYAAIVSIALWIYYFAFIFLVSAEISQIYFEKKDESNI